MHDGPVTDAFPRGLCVFCGQRGPLTDEHVWPDWLSRFLIDEPTSWVSADDQGIERVHTAPMFSRKVKRVCEQCNGGWMSALENEARPVLRWLILGRPCVIAPADARTLAAWLTKTAFMAAFLERTPAISPSHYRWLYEHRTPHRDLIVAVAGYRGRRHPIYSAHGDVTRQVRAQAGQPWSPVLCAYVSTVSIGTLVGQLIGVTVTGEFQVERPDWHLRAARVIWPVPPRLPWPPPPPAEIDDAGLFRLGRFLRGAQR
jgi:hypothetical protein